MKKLLYRIFGWFVGSLFFIACSKKTAEPPLTHSMAVRKVAVSVENIALTNREDFEMLVDLKNYEAQVSEGNTIIGIPAKEGFSFNYTGNISNSPNQSLIIYFASKKYGLKAMPGTKESMGKYRVQVPNVFNQQTKADLIKADLLSGTYNGVIANEIKAVKLTHANSLLQLKVNGLSHTDTLYVNDLLTPFLPYQVSADEYLAIVTGDWMKNEAVSGYPPSFPPLYIQIHTASGIKRVNLPPGTLPLKRNVKYEFKLAINPTSNSYTLENTSSSVWSAVSFPGF